MKDDLRTSYEMPELFRLKLSTLTKMLSFGLKITRYYEKEKKKKEKETTRSLRTSAKVGLQYNAVQL